MRIAYTATTTLIVLILANVTYAQFDFGRIIKGEARQMMRGLERDVVDQIRNEFRPKYRTLPYPPPTHNQPPICNQPPVGIYPIERGVVVPPNNSGTITSRKPVKLPKVELGTVVSINGQGFGEQPGAVFVKVDSIVLSTELVEWKDDLAEAKLPRLPIATATKATVIVMKADEQIAEKLDVMLAPATEAESDQEDAETPADSALPTVHSEQEVTLEGDLGEKTGRVELQLGELRLKATITEWAEKETSIKLPKLETAEAHQAKLVIYRADGEVTEEIDVLFDGQKQ